MSRLLNCCGRRKKTLLDLKDSMLGPFMLLALRGESSFIQVSGIWFWYNKSTPLGSTVFVQVSVVHMRCLLRGLTNLFLGQEHGGVSLGGRSLILWGRGEG